MTCVCTAFKSSQKSQATFLSLILSLFATINQICQQNDHLFRIILAQAISRITIALLLFLYPEGHPLKHVCESLLIYTAGVQLHLHNCMVLLCMYPIQEKTSKDIDMSIYTHNVIIF